MPTFVFLNRALERRLVFRDVKGSMGLPFSDTIVREVRLYNVRKDTGDIEVNCVKQWSTKRRDCVIRVREKPAAEIMCHDVTWISPREQLDRPMFNVIRSRM
ncbi:MAG: hypothetical protein AAFU85_21200 [Planctomycetota bacterium]